MKEVLLFFVNTVIILIQEVFFSIINLILFRKKSPKNISGQLALVTGGAQGFGKSIAERLAKEGCNIAICDINLEKAQKTCEYIRNEFKVSCEAFKADVSDVEQVNKLYIEIVHKMGTVDILVNNAGILAPLGILEGEDADIKRVININFTSHFWMVRKFLPSMIKQKRGHIVGICSAAGKITIPLATSYCATKFGLNGFYSSVYDDMCIYKYDEFINVTCVFPGFINTRNDLETLLDDTSEIIVRQHPKKAADETVKAVLLNKTEAVFPFAYKMSIIFMNIFPINVLKFMKWEISKATLNSSEKRLDITRV